MQLIENIFLLQYCYGCCAVAMWLLCGCYAAPVVAMRLLCGCYAVDMRLLYGCYAVAMRLLCGCCVVAMRLLCCCYVVAMRLLCCSCCCYEVAMRLLFHHFFHTFFLFPPILCKIENISKVQKRNCWHVQFIENIFLLQCLEKEIATAKELDLRPLGKVIIFSDKQIDRQTDVTHGGVYFLRNFVAN